MKHRYLPMTETDQKEMIRFCTSDYKQREEAIEVVENLLKHGIIFLLNFVKLNNIIWRIYVKNKK